MAFFYRLFAVGILGALVMGAKDPHSGPAMNYHAIDESLATSGHFVGDGLDRLAGQGLEVVIDLRPDAPEDQGKNMAALGIEYVKVPVSWNDPQMDDFQHFRTTLDKHRDKKVLVQCAANYRASAMTYLYRTLVDDTPEAEARSDMEAVWKPNRRWRKYIADVAAAHEEP